MNRDPQNNLRKAFKFSLRDGTRTFRDRLSRRDTDDIYRFKFKSSGQVDLTLSKLKANADLEIYSFKKSKRKVLKEIGKIEFSNLRKRDIRTYLKLEAKSRRGGKRSENISKSLEAGTYYIRVSSRRPKNKTRYRLELSASPALKDNPGNGNPDGSPDVGNPGNGNPVSNPSDSPGNGSQFQQLWLKQFGSKQDDQALTTVPDNTNQNIYVAGSIGGLLGDSSSANADAFIRKYSSDGVEQWHRKFGTSNGDFIDTVAVDSANNVYGIGTTDFSLPSGLNLLGESNAYLVQYDTNGGLGFEQKIDQGNLENGTGIALSSNDTIYVAGQSFGIDLSTLAIDFSPFINQYMSDGQFQAQIDPSFDSQGSAFRVLLDKANNLYVVGIRDATFSLADRNNPLIGDVFVAKYNTSGQNLWSRTLASADADFVNGITLDPSGNIYITGDTKGGLPGNSNQGGTDAYLAKFNTNGDRLWVKQYGTSGTDTSTGIAIDANGMIYLVGSTDGNLFENSNLGQLDGWLARVDSNGTVLNSTFIGTSENDRVNRISVDAAGTIYLAGETAGDLGETNQGGLDAWLAKYSFST